jgi:hypothetical protein
MKERLLIWLLTFACLDPPQVSGTCQRNIRYRALFFPVESHLHRFRDSLLRHHVSLHGRAFAMLHVLHRLDPVAPHLSPRHDPRI